MKTKREIVAELLQDENVKQVKNLLVKNVNVAIIKKDGREHNRISLTIDKEVDTVTVDEQSGEISEGKTNVIFTTPISIGAVLKDDVEIGFAVPMWNENLDAYRFILAGANIDVLQQRVPASVPYRNPFSTNEDGESTVWDVDKVINHVIRCEVLPRVKERVDKLADKLLGI